MSKEKAELIRKRKLALLKKQKEEKLKKESAKTLLSKEEKLELSKDLQTNALSTLQRFKFYKDGYMLSLGILFFTIISVITAGYFLFYSAFLYKAPNTYLPVNEQEQLLDAIPLSQSIYTDNEIRQFATDALNKLTDYNYVTVNSTYFTDIRDLFTKTGFKNYKEQFENSPEIKMVKTNYFVVSSNIVTDARLPKDANKALRAKSRKYVWVVELTSNRVYQNSNGFTYTNYKTRMIIIRTPRSENKKGIAIHSIVNEKI